MIITDIRKIGVGDKILDSVFVGDKCVLKIPKLDWSIGTYGNNIGYTNASARGKAVNWLNVPILSGAKKILYSSRNGIQYARQVFYGTTSDYLTAGNQQLYNDTAWQDGNTTIDLTQFSGRAITFGVLLANFSQRDKADLTIKIVY